MPDENVESATGIAGYRKPMCVGKPVQDHLPPALEFSDHVVHAILRALESSHGTCLRKGANREKHVLLHLHSTGHLLCRSRKITDAPACHGIGLGKGSPDC